MQKSSEDGYMLMAAMFLLFLLALSLSIAAPAIARSIQRDREVETMERGNQYRRAIQLYFRKYKSYPPSIDALVNTQNIRFLRKKYTDPMTGKDDWKPILFGQAKQPMAMGFFGEPLAGGATAVAGTGPSGGSSTGTGFGNSTVGGSGIGGSSLGGTGLGSSSGTGLGSSGGLTGLFGSSQSGAASTTSTGSGTAGTGTNPTGTGSSTMGTTGGTGTSSLGPQTGQSFGGAGVVGVEPVLTNQSILALKKMNHYNDWEFTYSPLSDQRFQAGGNTGTTGQPASTLNGQPGSTGLGGTTTGTGTSPFGTGTGSFGTNGTTGGTSTPQAQPQQ